MKKRVLTLFAVFLFCAVSSASARDVLQTFPIQGVYANGEAGAAILGNVKLYWGTQPHPPVVKRIGNYRKAQRTAIIGKTKKQACEWALAGAIKGLQQRAIRMGANAVINIKSNVNNNRYSSRSQYRCLTGGMVVRVALTGDVVRVGHGVGRTQAVVASQPEVMEVKRPDPLTMAVQQALRNAGYNPGPVDGFMGSKTELTLFQYQKDKNIPITGRFDQATLESLGILPSPEPVTDSAAATNPNPLPDTDTKGAEGEQGEQQSVETKQ